MGWIELKLFESDQLNNCMFIPDRVKQYKLTQKDFFSLGGLL